MTKTHWFVGTIGVAIVAITFGIIFMNPESEDISQMEMLLEAQEDRLILLEQTIDQLQGESESGISRREHQKHLLNHQAEFQRQRTKQDRRQLERTRQRQADLMQRIRRR